MLMYMRLIWFNWLEVVKGLALVLVLGLSPLLTASAQTASSYAGTGFAVSHRGHILTSYHVVQNAQEIRVTSSALSQETPATLLAFDADKDLALLSIKATTTPLRLALWESVPTGLEVYAMGYPQPIIQGVELKITSGLINAMEGPEGAAGFFQFSAPIQKGNSGGPVLGADGRVVGLVHAKLITTAAATPQDQPQNVNYAIRSKELVDFLEQQRISATPVQLDMSQVLRPHELFSKSQASVFAIRVVLPTTKQGAIPPATELPDDIRTALIFVGKAEQPRLFGAYQAGFVKVKAIGAEYVLIRPSTSDTPTTPKFEFILSLNQPRKLPGGEVYKSVLFTAQYLCEQASYLVNRREYKANTFGTGSTVAAYKPKEEVTQEAAQAVKSVTLRDFFKDSLCPK